MIRGTFISFVFGVISQSCLAQGPYAPPVGHSGTDAIHMDSTAIKGWASSCTIDRGWMDIADTILGKAFIGDAMLALGKAHANGVVSLGDGGVATLRFPTALYDGPGADFAVFENSFSNDFLELAFVEVSSNGTDYFRFPAYSLTDTSQGIGGFGSLDATQLHNFAGKYPSGYGTPFDLSEIPDQPNLDKSNITHLRIIDVVGTIDSNYASYDANGRAVVDPYPTPFPSSGFDLDAVGGIHLKTTGIDENTEFNWKLYPNPFSDFIIVSTDLAHADYYIFNVSGQLILEGNINHSTTIDLSALNSGIYQFVLIDDGKRYQKRMVK